MNFKEVFEKIKEHLTKEKLIGYWKWLWGKEPEPVDESVFEDPDRYIKVDEYDDSYWQDEKRYKREKRNLRIRRFFVSICVGVFVIVSLVTLRWTVVESVRHAIASNRFLMCMGKDVCIYEGPRMNYPSFSRKAISISNGDVFIYTDPTNIAYLIAVSPVLDFFIFKNPAFIIIDKSILNNSIYKISKRISYKFGKNKNCKFELYDAEHNKFHKFSLEAIPYIPHQVVKNIDNNPVFIPYPLVNNESEIYTFDIKNQKYIKTKFIVDREALIPNKLAIKSEPAAFRYILPYQNNKVLIRAFIEKGFSSVFDEYYFLDLKDFSIEKLPDFKIPVRGNYYSFANSYISKGMHNYKVLDNGKLLISIIDCKINKYGLCSENQEVNHIEIYDPVTNKFYAERKKDVMKNNLFTINKPNGDVLFINENSSYIFKNDTNKFEKADEEETRKNLEAVKRIKEKFREFGWKFHFGIWEPTFKVLEVSPGKYLIAYNILLEILPSTWKKTIYYDYEKNIVKDGPAFVSDHISNQPALKVDDNTHIKVDGYDGGLQIRPYYFPSRYSQIIYLKDP